MARCGTGYASTGVCELQVPSGVHYEYAGRQYCALSVTRKLLEAQWGMGQKNKSDSVVVSAYPDADTPSDVKGKRAAAAAGPPQKSACDGALDCSLNGACVGGRCHCVAGWQGDGCHVLKMMLPGQG